jgi:GAF domain-containing protein
MPAIDSEQEALRRVAELAARGASYEELFAVVSQELAQLVGAYGAALLRFESDDTVTLVATWNAAGGPVPSGECEPVTTALRRLRDTTRPLRCGPLDVPLTGPFTSQIRRHGIRALVAVPVKVDARVWGISVAASRETVPFPEETETQVARFTDLVAMAISKRGGPPRLGDEI